MTDVDRRGCVGPRIEPCVEGPGEWEQLLFAPACIEHFPPSVAVLLAGRAYDPSISKLKKYPLAPLRR